MPVHCHKVRRYHRHTLSHKPCFLRNVQVHRLKDYAKRSVEHIFTKTLRRNWDIGHPCRTQLEATKESESWPQALVRSDVGRYNCFRSVTYFSSILFLIPEGTDILQLTVCHYIIPNVFIGRIKCAFRCHWKAVDEANPVTKSGYVVLSTLGFSLPNLLS